MLNYIKNAAQDCVIEFDPQNLVLDGICRITVKGKNNLIRINRQITMKNLSIVIVGDNNNITIGEDNHISRAVIKINGTNSSIKIGNRNRIRDVIMENGEGMVSICVGDECLFSAGSQVKTHDSHDIIDIETGERINNPRDITIGDRVWLSQEALVLKGAAIGSNTIIGARAMVTRTIPPNVVAAGMPAKVLREGVRWEL